MGYMKYSCVMFDCDGTLVDTLEDIAAAMNKSLELHGFPPVPPPHYRSMVGWGITKLARLALPEYAQDGETVEAVAADASRIYCEQPLLYSKLYPGIHELAVELGNWKFKTAVLSNKPDPVLVQVIGGLFSPGTFTAVRGERPGGVRKPDPTLVWELLVDMDCKPHETIFVGDSEIDMETARNAGCYPLGISWGYRPRTVLETAGAARIIDTPDEFWDIFTQRK